MKSRMPKRKPRLPSYGSISPFPHGAKYARRVNVLLSCDEVLSTIVHIVNVLLTIVEESDTIAHEEHQQKSRGPEEGGQKDEFLGICDDTN